MELTWPGGQKITIEPETVIRVRDINHDIDGPHGNSRVDWHQPDVFEEAASEIAAQVTSTVQTFVSLTLRTDKPVWFNGEKAKGPLFVRSPNLGDGVNSALEIGGKIQYVKDTPEIVAKVIRDSGGTELPVRDPMSASPQGDTDILPNDVWDEEPISNQEKLLT